MSPVPSVSVSNNVNVHSTDEQLVLFLGRRRIGDPIPANVITEVNPFSIDPQNSPEKIWFLYNSHNEGSFIKGTNGYWVSIDDLRILTSTSTVGRKTIREFYVGQVPSGDRTCWRMHEYRAEQILAQGINKSKHKDRLCRFFLQNDEMLDNEEQCDRVSPGDGGGENKVSVLPSLPFEEGKNSSLKDTANRCQALLRDIENEVGLDMEEHVDCRFSASISVRSDEVVIPPPPPPAFGNKCNLVVIIDASTSSIPAPNHVLSSSAVEPQNDASACGSSRGSHRSATSLGSSQGSKSIQRMTKIRKKYCCFGSF